MKSSCPGSLFACAIGLNLSLCGLPLFAATTFVDIEADAFNPPMVTIAVNDQVVWTWVSSFHDTVSVPPGLWDSGIFNAGHVFTNTFATAGAFPYQCTVHGFTGTVNVQSANLPPSVTITNPVDSAVLSSSAGVTLRASASDADGTVTNVQFFDGAVSLANDTTSPYSFTATLAEGLHTLTAVAADNLGAQATSAPVQVTMARYLPAIPPGNIPIVLQTIATNLGAPDYAISPPGDATRLFVVEQNGLLRVVENGLLQPGAALDIRSRVSPPFNGDNANDERGFLGLAFHPGYTNPASPGYRTLYTYNSELIPASTSPTYPVPTTATNNYMNVVNALARTRAITTAAPWPSARMVTFIWVWAMAATGTTWAPAILSRAVTPRI